MIIDEKIIQI